MKKFEVGKLYQMASPCDHNCIWRYTVTARTKATITLVSVRGEVLKCRISKDSNYTGVETVYPLGKYSMCPVLNAEKRGEIMRHTYQYEQYRLFMEIISQYGDKYVHTELHDINQKPTTLIASTGLTFRQAKEAIEKFNNGIVNCF